MKNNLKSLSEKTLKSFLKKKKIGFTMSLLTSFLITGAVELNASTDLSNQILQNQEAYEQVQAQKSEILLLLKENESKLKELEMENLSLINEADWYSKSLYPSWFVNAGIYWKKADSQSKNQVTSNRADTANDIYRKRYTGNNKEYSGSGWIMNTSQWNSFAETYDNTAKIIVIPTTASPEIQTPKAPSISFSVPKMPVTITPPNLQTISSVNVSVSATQPLVSIPAVTVPSILPLSVNITEQNVNVGTISLNITPNMPTFSITPATPSLTMNIPVPASVVVPNPTNPSRTIELVNPDASPFSNFEWNWMNSMNGEANTNANSDGRYALADNLEITGGLFWSGVKPDGSGTIVNEAGRENATDVGSGRYHDSNITTDLVFNNRHQTIINLHNGRWLGGDSWGFWHPGYTISGGEFHVAGNVNGVSDGLSALGTSVFHLVGDVHIKDVDVYLYGMSAFINAEAFRGGQTTMEDVTINVLGDNNTVFHIKGSGPDQEVSVVSGSNDNYSGSQYATNFAGNADITVNTVNNSIYAVKSFAGGLKIVNDGEIVLNGASNIGVSILTWAPDKSKYIHLTHPDYNTSDASKGEGSLEKYIPRVVLDPNAPMKLYGDENVGIFFNSKTVAEASRQYDVGIHQGYFELFFDIGTQLNSDGTNTQISSGNLGKPGYTTAAVDGSVGVYAISGQRTGIDLTSLASIIGSGNTTNIWDTGSYNINIDFFEEDPIHNLIMDNFAIRFGKYSKNGFMFLAKNGTVIEIKNTPTQLSFSDGINGASTTEGDSSEKTIITYAEGKWTAAGTGLATIPAAALENKSTEIIVDKELNMMSKEGIAFFATDNGKITVNQNAEGYGYKSIMAYAENNGLVYADSSVVLKATDEDNSTNRTNKYQNIGGYAGTNGTVVIDGNVNIHGIGAFATGSGAEVQLNGSNNTIKTGISGGLVALNGGKIDFGGGKIEHKTISSGSHDGKVAFYADNSSKINFTGATTIEIHNGAVFYGATTDYASAAGAGSKYSGMANVTVKLMEDGVNIGSFAGETVTWTGSTGLTTILQAITKVGSFDPNGKDWIISFTDGTFGITTATDYNADKLKNVVLEKEIVNIAGSAVISSNLGNSIMVTSNSSATANSSAAINNYGTINITGGTAASAAFGAYVNFGQVANEGRIDVDNGVGIYGENGSKLENKSTGVINITKSGVGIAARATRTGGPDNYGTDAGKGTNLIQIDNLGTINVAGNSGVGIYADNNSGLASSRHLAIINNNKSITVGDNGIGVMMSGAADGGTVTLTTTGGSDINVGKNGVGVYGENSDINLVGSSYNVSVKDNGIGIMTEGNTKLASGTLKLNYIGATTENAIGIAYKGNTAATLTNSLNVEVTTPSNMSGNVTGLFLYNGGKIINNGNITATADGAYGIISNGVDVENIGIVTAGNSTGTGGIGIYSKDASIKTDGENIAVDGNEAIGIYALNDALTSNKTIEINHGTGNLQVKGKKAIGIYLKDNYLNSRLILDNNDNIDIAASLNINDRKVGLFVENTRNAANETSGIIDMAGTATSGYNVGIYSKNSNLIQSGNINISGISNVGIYAESTGSNTNTLNLTNGNINITTAAMADANINVGIYGEGNNVTINSTNSNFSVSANAQGIYLNGGNSTVLNGTFNFDLKSNTSGKLGIGSYFKGGSYANSSSIIKLTSSLTAIDGGTGEAIRPIGLYYGSGSSKNEADIEVISGSSELIGMHTLSLASFTNTGNITLNATGIGAYYSNSNVINSGNVNINAANSYGLFFKGGSSYSTGTINIASTATGSFGVISKGTGTSYDNRGTIILGAANSMGAAAVDQGYIKNTGNIDIYTGYGAIAMDNGSEIELANNSIIEEKTATTAALIGTSAINGGKITLNGGDIKMSANSLGIYLSQGQADLKSGDIEVGTDGIGIYAKNTSKINMTAYSGEIKMGNNGVAIYSEDSTLGSGGTLDLNYAGYADKGVGIYYATTSAGTAVTNNVSINHTGNNLVNIYAAGVKLTNTAAQTVRDEGIGFYGVTNANIANTGVLKIEGDNSIGIYLNGNSTLSAIGTIKEDTAKSAFNKYKIGIYVDNGNILGNSIYNFEVDGGVGIYLKNNAISYTGTINVKGNNVQHTPTVSSRAIGIYASSAVNGTINANINVTGKEAIGLYLEEIAGVGANITYNGDIAITSLNTGEKGVGAYLSKNTTLTLGSTGSMTIGGTENIGFYVDSGAVLNVTGGTVTNTAEGIFAYIKDGSIVFASGSSPNINYANVIVSGTSGTLTNSTTITVGTSGLQAANGGKVHNTATGVINGTIQNGMAIAGENVGTTLINDGNIILTGDKSVGIYTGNGAQAISTGGVEVGKGGIAYYADTNSTINASGTTKVKEGGVILYSNGGTINYNGADLIGAKETTIAIAANSSSLIDFNNKNITIGESGTGIIIEGTASMTNIQNLGKITVGKEATGIYLNSNQNSTINADIVLNDTDAVGVLTTKNGDIIYNAVMTSSKTGAKGIISTGTGNLVNSGILSINGQANIGIYGEGSNSIINQNTGTIEVGAGTNTNSSIGIFGKNAAQIINNGIIKIKENSVAIYGENALITNTGTISNTIGNNTGIYGVGGSISNIGTITLSDESNGIYLANGSNILNNGNVTVGNNKSSGIYGSGATNVFHNSGIVTVGDDSVGLATDSGNLTVSAGAQILAGENSTSIYTGTGTGKNYQNLTLSNYGIGMHTKSGIMENYGIITLGESSITTTPKKISMGMATESGYIENNGTINIPKDYGIGMAVTNGGTAINNSIINIDGNSAYGIQGLNRAVLENHGVINVNGTDSRGITGVNGTTILNTGSINVNGAGSEGVYIETQSTLNNQGNIVVNGPGRTGIFIGTGGKIVNLGTVTVNGGGTASVTGEGSIVNVGDITINGPTVTIDGVTITNTGTITINGALDFDTVKISGNGTNDYVGTINAETLNNGQFIVLSDVTKGSNKDMYIIQYLQGMANTPNNGNLSAISESVSYVVDIQKDPLDSNKISLVLVKIPYIKMMEGTSATEFAKGLDELYSAASGRELDMFDSLDMISNDDELATTFENELRGNEYANIQDRMMDINAEFNQAYANLKHNRIYSKESTKIGLITASGESKYKGPAVIDYDQKTIGVMALKEYDSKIYGQKYGWHIGFAQNKFEFDSDSKETAYSLNMGLSYEKYLGSDELKWQTKSDLTVNHHEMDRKIDISGTRYSNDSKYWSGMATVKNIIRYEQGEKSGRIRTGIQGTFDLGYGRYFNIKEKGDGMYLQLPATDMYTIRPGIGADITLTNRIKKSGAKVSLIGKVSAEYELGEIYDNGNKAKFKNTDTGYYRLEEPKKEKAIGKIGAELKYENREGNAISFEISRQEGRKDYTRYGINFMIRID